MKQKTRVSTDKLYKFMNEHDFTAYVLSEYMGVSESIVRGCFRHDLSRHGKPLQFSEANLAKLNEALPRMAADLRGCVITFDDKRAVVNRCGTAYDLTVADQVKAGMGRFFNMRSLTKRVFGWNAQKCSARLASEGSITYSHVSRENCDRLNDELLAIAGVLDNYDVYSASQS